MDHSSLTPLNLPFTKTRGNKEEKKEKNCSKQMM